jgi:hypothetical protein
LASHQPDPTGFSNLSGLTINDLQILKHQPDPTGFSILSVKKVVFSRSQQVTCQTLKNDYYFFS